MLKVKTTEGEAGGREGVTDTPIQSPSTPATSDSGTFTPTWGQPAPDLSPASPQTQRRPDGQAVPVAVTGMACRLPGECSTPSKLWETLVAGRDTWKPRAPADRFNWEAFHHPDLDFQGTFTVDGGHFSDYVNLQHFDAGLFSVPNAEAQILDPQQRLLLEVSYECLESAGVRKEDIAGKRVGCFVAFSMAEYSRLWEKDMEYMHNQHILATGEAMYANRISHVYDLAGPSMAMDTGCSGSLVALDVACKYLAAGAIDACFVAGTHLNLTPDLLGERPRLLSKSGRCHTFDSKADGFSRADGTSVLFLKRLDDAVKSRDPIRSVIRATATNFDGRTPGVFMPSMAAQMANIRQAYARAGIDDLGATSYFECHGTGTATGDPIEVEAIGRVFAPYLATAEGEGGGEAKAPAERLLIGSNKPNMGHSEAASALTSIMKSTFALEHGVIPPTVGIEQMNPNIDFDRWPVEVVQALRPLPRKGGPPRISINAFGYGGANAHAILEAAPGADAAAGAAHVSSLRPAAAADAKHARRPYLLVHSANDAPSVQAHVAALREHLAQHGAKVDRLDLAYTLGARRSQLHHRAFTVVPAHQPPAEALARPEALVTGKQEFDGGAAPRVAFVFTGQGAQRPQMGRDLIEAFPSVQATLARLDAYLARLPAAERPAWSVRDELLQPEGASRIHDPRFAQTLTCAMQICLTNLLRAWGVAPSAVVGHSSGEIPAAYAAGLLDEAMAIRLGYYRGFSLTSGLAPDDGLFAQCGMMAVGLGRDAVAPYLAPYAGDLALACDNSPESVTISGSEPGLARLGGDLGAAGVFHRVLRVPKAYHNPRYMAGYSAVFKESLEATDVFDKAYRLPPPSAAMFSSTIKHAVLVPSDVHNGEYWRRNMEGCVLFTDAVNGMLALPADQRPQLMLEIGPSSTLKGPIRQLLGAAAKRQPNASVPAYLPTLIGGSNSAEDMLRAAGALFNLGVPLNLERVNAWEEVAKEQTSSSGGGRRTAVRCTSGRTIVDLPHYVFNHSKAFWTEPRVSRNHRLRKRRRHEILGSRLPDESPALPTWRNLLSLANTPWLPHHRLHDDIVFPAAGYLCMAAEAVRQLTDDQQPAVEMRHVHVRSALVMNNTGHGRYVFLTLARHNAMSRWYDFSICSEAYDQPAPAHAAGPAEPEVHCSGQVAAVNRDHEARPLFAGDDVPAEAAWTVARSGRPWYKNFARIGFAYTESFQVLDEVRGVEGEKVVGARLRLPATAPRSRYLLPPGVIDGAMQALLAAAAAGKPGALADLCVPTTFDRVFLAAPAAAADGGEPAPFLNCLARADDADPELGVGSGNVVGHAEARDARGNVVLAFQRLACTRIEAGGGASATDRTLVHKVQWRPDFSLLASSAWTANSKDAISGHNPPLVRLPLDNASPIPAVVDMLGHTYPAARWAAVCRDEADLAVIEAAVQPLVAVRDQPRRLAHFAVLARDKAMVEVAEKRVGEWIEDSTLSSVTLLPEGAEGIEAASFDNVVAVNTVSGLPLASLLGPDGRLLLARTSDDALPRTLEAELKKAGLSGVDLEIQTKPGQQSVVISTRTPAPEGEAGLKSDGVPVLDQPQADLLTNLLSLATSQRPKTTVPFSVDLGRAIVVLATLRDPMLLTDMSEDLMARLRPLAASKKPVVWCTRDSQMACEQPEGAMVQGLARVLSQENPDLVLITVDTDRQTPAEKLAHLILAILDRQAGSGPGSTASGEREFAVRQGIALTNRVVPDADLFSRMHPPAAGEEEAKLSLAAMEAGGDRHWKFDILQPGLLHTLAFLEMTAAELAAPLGPDEMEIDMRAAGVNFKDVAISQGLVPQKPLGFDVAGVVTRVGPGVTQFRPGDRVAGAVEGAYRSRTRAYAYLCFPVPDAMGFEEAASLPIVWYTNIIAMMRRGGVRSGESVLVHSAAGGVGLSAIALARHLGADIYATVGSPEKRALLVDSMGVPADRVFDSRSASFQADVMRATRGRGVDFVVDSMAGDLLDESWNCLAENGTMLSLGKVDFQKRHKLQMRNFSRARNFCAIDTEIYMKKNKRNAHEIVSIMKDLLAKKVVQAVQPLQVHNVDELPSVFRHIQSGKSVGKMVIRRSLSEGKDVAVRPAINPLVFPSDASYLLIGCLGGIGRSITRWMFDHGARNFIMLSPRGGSGAQAQTLCSKLRRDGATVALVKGSAAVMEDVERAIASAPPGKPVKGMLHAAMVLNDAAFPSLTAAQFRQTTAAKVDGARNLHEASLRYGHALDFFVMLSSVSGLFGQHGQAAYAAANSYLDSLAAHRTAMGLPATALDLGFVDDIGWAMENEDLDVKLEQLGMLTVRVTETEVLRLLEISMQRSAEAWRGPSCPRDDAAAAVLAFDSGACQIACGLTSTGQKPWSYFAAPRFRALLNTDSGTGGELGAAAGNNASPSSAAEAALLAALQDKAAKSKEGALAALAIDALSAKLAEYLLLNIEDLDVKRSPEVLGIDSLVAVSLRTWLRDRFGATVATMEILKASSLKSLGELVAERL